LLPRFDSPAWVLTLLACSELVVEQINNHHCGYSRRAWPISPKDHFTGTS